MPSHILTQELLKERLIYTPSTGIFTWRTKESNFSRIIVGSPAGHIHKTGYLVIRLYFKAYRAHRLAFLYMLGHFPLNQVDHVNRNKLDNSWINLRPASYVLNNKNKTLQKNNKSKYTGVSWRKDRKFWIATITVNKKLIYLGSSYNFDEAVAMRQAANIKYGFHPNHGQTV